MSGKEKPMKKVIKFDTAPAASVIQKGFGKVVSWDHSEIVDGKAEQIIP